MSAAPAPLRRERRRPAARAGLLTRLPDLLFLAALTAIGMVAAWPIHRDPWFLLAAGGAAVAGAALALLPALRSRPWWATALAGAGTYFALGMLIGAPSALTDPARLPSAALGVLSAPVTGWKNLLTLDLPVGTYQTTLTPTILVFLVVPLVSLRLAGREGRSAAFAPPVALTMPLYGILFGSSAVRGVLTVGPVTVPGVVELLTGAAAVLVALAWTIQRTVVRRSAAVRRTQEDSGLRVDRVRRSVAGRWLVAGAMGAIATVVGIAVAPLAVAGDTRDVLRTGVDPELRIRSELSPLTTYRQFFADDAYDSILFEVDAADAERVRLATLGFYDGVVARVTDPTGERSAQETAFTRVPTAGDGSRAASVTIGDYDGLWVPVVGEVSGVEFSGEQRSALTDGFFTNDATATAVELADPGLEAGVRYTLSSAGPAATVRDLAALEPTRSAPRFDDAVVPDSLQDWIDAQDAGTGGPALALLVERLRARGYLSHALTEPGQPAAWQGDLDGYVFEPSRPGHSTDRIDELFRALTERQSDVGGADDAALVAAPGDDEQFAVAAALIADHLGFETRVVLGARLRGDDELPTCRDGACRGGDMAVWLEVQDADGTWAIVDVTPQHTVPITPDIEQRSDPQIPTEVDGEAAEEVPPPDAAPSEGGDAEQEAPAIGPDLSALWSALRIGGASLALLLVFLSPFLAVLAAKGLRRRSRRGSADPADRVAGGWDDYVDAAVDRGLPAPRTHTRTELARLYDADGNGGAMRLASWADRSVFSHVPPTDAESAAFWELVEEERRRMDADRGWWGRLRARLSPRSLRRRPAGTTGRGRRRDGAERGTRVSWGPAPAPTPSGRKSGRESAAKEDRR